MNLNSMSLMLFLHILPISLCQLVVNVKNSGGDVYRENINANTTQDTVTLEFRKADGTVVTQLIDGRNEIQIFKVVILPEEERGQTQVQTLCFISHFAKNEFISSDAMSKLRQKNPSAVRHPEETRPEEFLQLNLLLDVPTSHVLSPHIVTLCSDASEMTYVSDGDLRLISQILNRDYETLQSIAHNTPFEGVASCQAVTALSQPCICHYDLCVGWYPCGLKYCRGKDSANHVVSYRCGIKTCSKCRSFEFLVKSKSLCIWDEAEFTFDPELTSSTEMRKPSSVAESNVAPMPDVPKLATEHDSSPRSVVAASIERDATANNPPVVKMEQKLVIEVPKKAPNVSQTGTYSKSKKKKVPTATLR